MSDLELFLGECYDFRKMAEEHEDEMLRFQVSGEWVFKFQFQRNGFLVSGEWVFLRFSSWMLGKNTRMKMTRVVREEHDLGLLGFCFQVKVKFGDFR